jgi:cell division inhibitor SepF
MSMLRKAMHYLGLAPDDEYDDDYYDEPAPAAPMGSSRSAYVPPEPPEAHHAAVRPLPRSAEPGSGQVPAVRTTGVVRPLTPQGSAKPFPISPTSFNEAQSLADKYMAGIPVIMNLQGLERDLSRRLVDFASGLCYGMRGSMERVTNQVYLLTPSNVEVSAEEKRRLREND